MAGFVNSNFEVKLIIMYILSKMQRPITFDELSRVAYCEQDVNYFSVKQSVEELIQAKNIVRESHLYYITTRGRENFKMYQNTLPPMLLRLCDQEMYHMEDDHRKAGQTYAQSSVNVNEDDTYSVRLAIVNARSVFLELKYIVSTRAEADDSVAAFQANPHEYYEQIMHKLRDLSQGKNERKSFPLN